MLDLINGDRINLVFGVEIYRVNASNFCQLLVRSSIFDKLNSQIEAKQDL